MWLSRFNLLGGGPFSPPETIKPEVKNLKTPRFELFLRFRVPIPIPTKENRWSKQKQAPGPPQNLPHEAWFQ